MKINTAVNSDAIIIHDLMIKAFMEYKNETPPSSALEETVESVSDALERGEKALIAYEENEPVGMVRFQLTNDGLYFYRLSVVPEKQGKGIAKQLLNALEEYARKFAVSTILCKVRKSVPKNIQLYSSLDYRVYNEVTIHKTNDISLNIVLMKKEL